MLNCVFVYGTLMQGMSNAGVISPFVEDNISAVAGGMVLFDIPGYGFPAVIAGDGKVLGELIWLKDIEKAMPALDSLEDFYGPASVNNMYERIVTECITKNGSKEECYIYVWSHPEELQEIGAIVPDGDWRKVFVRSGV